MAKKGKIADPHAAREAARYDNPIPSREVILDLLTQAKKPLNHNKIARKLARATPAKTTTTIQLTPAQRNQTKTIRKQR